MSKYTLHLGDCLEYMRGLPDGCFDAVVTDPPYGQTEMYWDEAISVETVSRLVCLSASSNVVLFSNALLMSRLILSEYFRYEMVWKKSKCGSPFTAKYMPLKRHEFVLVFGKPASLYNSQMTAGKPYSRKMTKSKVNNHGYGIVYVKADNDGVRYPGTVLDFNQNWKRQDQVHPTQKPVELIAWLIRSYSNPGDTIFDPFMGSGTTGVACMQLGRKFVGCEIDPEYYAIAEKRISEAAKQPPLFVPEVDKEEPKQGELGL